MGKIVLATIIISGSAKWLLKVGGNKEKWYGSDRIFMYVMTVFGAMTVNYSEQCTEYGWVVSNLRLLAGCLLAGGLLSAAYMVVEIAGCIIMYGGGASRGPESWD